MQINTTQNTTTENPWPYVPLDPKQGFILFLITLPGTLANIVAFLATLKLIRQQRNVAPNYVILALNFTDFYGITFCTLPTLLCYLFKRWVGGDSMCNFQSVSMMFASLASGILATAMATDRLLAIWKPFVYKRYVNLRKTTITIVIAWLSAFIIAILPLAGEGFFVRNLTGTYCTINWFAKRTANQVYAVFYAIIGVAMIAIVVFCNVKIVHTLIVSKMRQGTLHGLGSADDKRKKSEMQLMKSVGAISLLFVVCWFPFMIRIICNLTGTWEDPWVDVQVSRLLLINFVLDPFLYTLSRKQCRDIVKSWFCCCCYSEGRRSSIFSRWFAVMRKKHGSFLSSSQTGSGHNVNSGTTISTVQLVHMKNASGDTTPSQSVSDVVVHTSMIHGPSNEQGILHDKATEPAQNGRPLAVTTDENEKDNDDSENEDNSETRPMHRLHSEVHRKESKQLEEKTASLPNLAEIGGERNDDEVKVDVGFLYDLAYQRQESK